METAVAAFGGAAPTWATDRDRAGADRRRHLDDTATLGIRGVWDQPGATRLLALGIGLLPLFGAVSRLVVSQRHSLSAKRRRKAPCENAQDVASMSSRAEGFRHSIELTGIHGRSPPMRDDVQNPAGQNSPAGFASRSPCYRGDQLGSRDHRVRGGPILAFHPAVSSRLETGGEARSATAPASV